MASLLLRRGFDIKKGLKVIIIEDVITTGKSSKECIVALQKYKTEVLGVFSIVNRSMQDVNFDVCTYSLLNLRVPFISRKSNSRLIKKKNPHKQAW